jgi:hypothetical protein
MSKESDAIDAALREGAAAGAFKRPKPQTPKPEQKPLPAPPGGFLPRARDDSDDDTTSYTKGGRVHGDEAEDTALFNRLMTKHQNPGKKYAKGGAVEETCYAKGGEVLGRRREFMKEKDPFSANTDNMRAADASFIKMQADPGSPQEYTKKGKGAEGKDKSLKTVMPRE